MELHDSGKKSGKIGLNTGEPRGAPMRQKLSQLERREEALVGRKNSFNSCVRVSLT